MSGIRPDGDLPAFRPADIGLTDEAIAELDSAVAAFRASLDNLDASLGAAAQAAAAMTSWVTVANSALDAISPLVDVWTARLSTAQPADRAQVEASACRLQRVIDRGQAMLASLRA